MQGQGRKVWAPVPPPKPPAIAPPKPPVFSPVNAPGLAPPKPPVFLPVNTPEHAPPRPLGFAPVTPLGFSPPKPLGFAPVMPPGFAAVTPLGFAPVMPPGFAAVTPVGISPPKPLRFEPVMTPVKPLTQSTPPVAVKGTDSRQFIKSFSFNDCNLGSQGFQRLLLQVFGYSGHGKSSFINTCKIVWENSAYINHTKSSARAGGDTMDRRTYPLTENIILVDNRGCAALRSYEKGEIFAQLGNLMPLDMKVDWGQGFKLAERIVEAEPLVKPSDFISPILVYSMANSPNPDEKKELRFILEKCREMTGVDATVVLTHKAKGSAANLEAMFRDMGVEHLYTLENYTPSNHSRSAEIDNAVMEILQGVIQDAQFRVNCPHDPQKEMTERKVFVLKYIHLQELEAEKQKLERQIDGENAKIDKAMKERRDKEEKERQEEAQRHQERMRSLQEEFERQRLRDQYEYEQRKKEFKKNKGRST